VGFLPDVTYFKPAGIPLRQLEEVVLSVEVNKMPRGDGTGPLGLGPMTGRKAAFCAGFPVPGFMNPVGRRFPHRAYCMGLGAFGFGRGWRWCYYATGLPFWARFSTAELPEDEKALEAKILAHEAKMLKEQLRAIEERLNELEKPKKEGPKDEAGQE
jgi:hypothetical protein